MVNSEELIGTTEYLTLYTKCRINRWRYSRVGLYMNVSITTYKLTYKGEVTFSRYLLNTAELFLSGNAAWT
jgi:hypothetical protein